MADPFVAEIRIFGFNFAPKGWAFCNGQLLPLSQNTALFSLLGTTYGGDGKSTFALPDMQGNSAMFWGDGQGLTSRYIGEMGGSDTVTLLQSEIPAHNHLLNALNDSGLQTSPDSALSARTAIYNSSPTVNAVIMNFQATSVVGSSFPHDNMQPYLTMNFCIALQGVFPPRG